MKILESLLISGLNPVIIFKALKLGLGCNKNESPIKNNKKKDSTN
jgi:hypothetical protein